MDIDILSLFPDYFTGPFDHSIVKRAREKELLTIRHVQLRDFATDKHRSVDDRPYGGGPGMVIKPEPAIRAIHSVRRPGSHVIYLSPQGKVLTAAKSRELACGFDHLILLCGHYEGVDQRIIEQVDEEISIGDFVLTNGGLAAIVLVDTVIRFLPGVLGHEEAAERDSFEEGIFGYPQYTRPSSYAGQDVPAVLLNGNHSEIAAWRKQQAVEKTARVRPDLCPQHFSHIGVETSKRCDKKG